MADSVYAFVVPIVIIVVVLKISLICCRIWLYQKRREQQILICQQRRVQAQCATARVVSVRQIRGPGGIAQQTSYAIEQPGRQTQQLTRTIIVRPASRRPNDPNLPPTYDQAVTGADRSVRVQEGQEALGKNPLQQPMPRVQVPPQRGLTQPPPPVPVAAGPIAPPGMTLPHMPPPRNPPITAPPPYMPAVPSAPSPDIDISDRQRLLQ